MPGVLQACRTSAFLAWYQGSHQAISVTRCYDSPDSLSPHYLQELRLPRSLPVGEYLQLVRCAHLHYRACITTFRLLFDCCEVCPWATTTVYRDIIQYT